MYNKNLNLMLLLFRRIVFRPKAFNDIEVELLDEKVEIKEVRVGKVFASFK